MHRHEHFPLKQVADSLEDAVLKEAILFTEKSQPKSLHWKSQTKGPHRKVSTEKSPLKSLHRKSPLKRLHQKSPLWKASLDDYRSRAADSDSRLANCPKFKLFAFWQRSVRRSLDYPSNLSNAMTTERDQPSLSSGLAVCTWAVLRRPCGVPVTFQCDWVVLM